MHIPRSIFSHRPTLARSLRALVVLPLVSAAGLAGVTLGAPAANASTTIVVNTTADSADGAAVCTGGAVPCSLYDAVNYADTLPSNSGSPTTIEVPAGTYDISAANPLPFIDSSTAQAINIEGLGSDPSDTVIDGGGTSGSGQSILLDDAVASESNTFSDLTFQNGFSNESGFGGGALNWAGSPSVLDISDCIFQNNVSQNDGGGAILDANGTSLSITGSTFQDNSTLGIIGSVASGGAIDATVPNLSVSDSTFVGNVAGAASPSPNTGLSAQGDGGAIIVGYGAGSPSFSVTDSDFSGNLAYAGYQRPDAPLQSGQGGAISDDSGPLTVSDSRLAGNETVSGGAPTTQDLAFVGGEGEGTFGSAVSAEDDWWGVNSGPQGGAFMSDSSVSVTDGSWLELQIAAASSDVLENGSSPLDANLYETNNSGALSGLSGLPPFASTTIFSTNFGSLGNASSDFVSGDAGATFEAPSNGGVATVDATLDGQVVGTSITVGIGPGITENPSPVEVCAGNTATFDSAASGSPTPTVQWESEPSGGGGFSNISGATSPDYSFTAEPFDNGSQYQAAYNNVFSSQTTTAATLTVDTAPIVVLNPTNDTVTSGQTATFTAAGTGSPTPTVQWYVEPNGSSVFAPISGATNPTFSFTAGTGDNGSRYQAIFTNTCNTAPTTTASLTVTGQAPGITSADSANFTVGQSNTFTVETNGIPTSAISESGSLPNGVSFQDNGDGTATLSGTPLPGTAGIYDLAITASNGVTPEAQQDFTLTVVQAPAITSNDAATFAVGSLGTFTVQTTGSPTSAISQSGSLPNGVNFQDNGDSTATLSGTPAAGTGGTYPIVITASNGVSPDAQQDFTLTVVQAPAITSPRVAAFADGVAGSYTITTLGSPAPTISETHALPTGLHFVDNGDGTATISGSTSVRPAVYEVRLTAQNGSGKVTTILSISVVADSPGETVTAACAGRHVRNIRLAMDMLQAVGGGTLDLQAGCTYVAGVPRYPYPYTSSNGPDWLPPISVPITIDGNGSTITQIAQTANPARFFGVTGSGSLDINDLSLVNSVDASNDGGGAIFNDNVLQLTNVTLSDDQTLGGAYGGAVESRGSLAVSSTTFSHDAGLGGGGVAVVAGTASISGSTFVENSGVQGGGVESVVSTLTMVDDTMVENSADVGGGGVATDAGETSITDSTFEGNIDNHAGFGGAAVLVNGGGILNLAGTLLAKAAGAGECSNAGGSIVDGGYNLSDDSSCAFSGTSGNGDIDQFLGGIANNGGPVATVAELKGAPSIDVVPATAVDVNNLALCAGTDARGVPRPQTGCDIGSFQTISTTTTISTSSDDITKGSPVTFTATVTPSVAPQALGGSVKFYRSDGGQAVLLNTELLNGSSPDQSILTTTSLPVGVWTITAVYEGATGFASSSTATGVTVTVTH